MGEIPSYLAPEFAEGEGSAAGWGVVGVVGVGRSVTESGRFIGAELPDTSAVWVLSDAFFTSGCPLTRSGTSAPAGGNSPS